MSRTDDDFSSGDESLIALEGAHEQRSRARSVALRQLAAAPRTRYQLEQALAAKDIEQSIIEEVLDRYVDVGLIDDFAFTEVFVRSRLSERGMAKRAIALELKRRGVDPQTIQVALERVDPDDEMDAARRLVEKKLRSLRGVEPHVRYRRIAGALGRKGFTSSIIRQVLDEALSEYDASEGSLADEPWTDPED